MGGYRHSCIFKAYQKEQTERERLQKVIENSKNTDKLEKEIKQLKQECMELTKDLVG